MNRGLLLIFVAASLIVLAGCSISVEPRDPFPNAPVVDVVTDPNSAVAVTSLAPGDAAVYEMVLDSSDLDFEAVFFELDSTLDLYVYRSNGNLYATSSSAAFFGAGTMGLSAAATTSEIQPAVVISQTCRGSCVIRNADSARFFVGIENNSGSTASFSLYAYAAAYADSGEFENNFQSTAIGIGAGGDSGAIEYIGDVDYYRPMQSGSLTFDTSATVPVEATIITENGNRFPMTPRVGERVETTDLIEVRVAGSDEAAVSSNSTYFLSY